MKKFVAVLAALVCVFGLSVSSFAYVVHSPSEYPDYLVEKNGHYAFNYTIPASTFDDNKISFWNSWTSAFTGNDPLKIAILCKVDNLFDFILIDSNYTFKVSGSNTFLIPSSSSGSFRYLRVSHNASSGFSVMGSYATGSVGFCVSGKSVVFAGHGKLSNLPANFSYLDLDGKSLEVNDDLGGEEPDPEPPEEPDESSSSSAGGWTPPIISDPEIPAGDEYVFYDTAVLKDFLKYVRDAIGKSINVGWLIFGFILMWLIIKKVIKSFSSR